MIDLYPAWLAPLGTAPSSDPSFLVDENGDYLMDEYGNYLLDAEGTAATRYVAEHGLVIVPEQALVITPESAQLEIVATFVPEPIVLIEDEIEVL